MSLKGTRAAGIRWFMRPFGEMKIYPEETYGSRTMENGAVQYGFTSSEGSITWSPINIKKGKR